MDRRVFLTARGFAAQEQRYCIVNEDTAPRSGRTAVDGQGGVVSENLIANRIR